MFERFTDAARRVVVLAQEEARLVSHGYIGTEHVLLGLLREGDGLAARALDSLGIQLQAARPLLGQSAGRRPGPSGHIPFTPEAKRLLEQSLREAMQLGHDYIGTEHILLGLIRDPSSHGARMLADLGTDAASVRQRVLDIVPAGTVASGQAPVAAPGTTPRAEATMGYGPLSSRLTALERWSGLVPDLADLDDQIAQVRQDTEAAIDAHEFRTAEALSDSERELMAERDRRSRQRAAGPSLAEQVARLQTEIDRLHEVLRSHGIDPGARPDPGVQPDHGATAS